MQQEKRIFDVTRLDKDMQLQILMNIPNPDQYFPDYQSRFSNLSAIIGQEDTIKLSILFYGEGSIPKPIRDTKGKQVNYSGKNTFNKISRYLGQELAEQLEKASKEDESLKYVSVIHLPDAEDLFKQVTEQDYHNLIFQDWEEFTKKMNIKKKAMMTASGALKSGLLSVGLIGLHNAITLNENS